MYYRGEWEKKNRAKEKRSEEKENNSNKKSKL
jgi:hypothetical protein